MTCDRDKMYDVLSVSVAALAVIIVYGELHHISV